MQGEDGKGSSGKGQRTGGSNGRGQGRGRRPGTGSGAGPEGYCICQTCGEKTVHRQGTPCYDQSCPKCGTPMVRE